MTGSAAQYAAWPATYWINLRRSHARRLRMQQRFSARGLHAERVEAIDGNDPVSTEQAIRYSNVPTAIAACTASHLSALRTAFAAGHPYALILEDDITFELWDAWPEGWQQICAALPTSFSVVRLCVAETPRELDRLFGDTRALVPMNKLRWCAGAYLISRPAMAWLLESYASGERFDVSELNEEQDPEHVIFASLRQASQLAPPVDARVPLFIYEGNDSELHPSHLDRYARARRYVLEHHPSLRANTYRSPFGAAHLARQIASVPRQAASWLSYLPRLAYDQLTDRLGYYKGGADQHQARYISQHAMAFSAHANGGARYVLWGIEGRPELIDWTNYDRLQPGDTAWVRIEDLSTFNQRVLPRLKGPIQLITGESDYCVPRDFAEAARVTAASGLVSRWFATNFDHTEHQALITPVPLGMNYRKKHDLHLLPGPDGTRWLRRERFSIAEQERRWEAIAQAAPPPSRRLLFAYADFHLNNSSFARRYGESRNDIAEQLRHNPSVVFPSYIVDSDELYTNYGKHAFVISPHGRGLDCYRTWDALFMGAIVIVKRSPLDVLYRGLPVVIVDDWGELTQDNLVEWLSQYGDDFDRAQLKQQLRLDYWTRQWAPKPAT